jgi:hypothetical protein
VAWAAENEALKQQITVLTGQVQEYQNLYQRQHGMVAPLQRKTAEQERTIADLTKQVEDLKQIIGSGGAPPPQTPQAVPPTSISEDDPKLKEFMDLYGDMIPGLEHLIRKHAGELIQPQLQQIKPAVEFLERQTAKTERDGLLAKHLAPLYARYPNAGAITQSPQFAQWVEQRPSYVRDSIMEKLLSPENFPVEQIISIYDDYSRDATATPAPPASAAAPGPGEMAVDVRRVPTSSTPGGQPGPQPLDRARLAFINRALTVDRGLYSEAQIASLKDELAQGEAAAINAGYGLAPRLDTLTSR